MNEIIAIVDCQGFQFKNRFVPREVAIVGKFISQCQELNPEINWRELPKEEQETVLYTTKYVNGLHFMPFNPIDQCFVPKSQSIGDVLKLWYEMYLTLSENKEIVFGFKNQQMGKILEENNIPCFNLDDANLNFPNYKVIAQKYGSNYLCCYHKRPPRNCDYLYICAYRKSCYLYREVLEFFNKNSDWNNM